MKKHNKNIPAAAKLNLLRPICNLIADFLVPQLARATGVQDQARTFSPWSHLVALVYVRGNCKAFAVIRVPTEQEEGDRTVSRQRQQLVREVRSRASKGAA